MSNVGYLLEDLEEDTKDRYLLGEGLELFTPAQEMTQGFEGGFIPEIHDVQGVPHVGYGFNITEPHVKKQIPEDVLSGKRNLTEIEGNQIFKQLYKGAEQDTKSVYGKEWESIPEEAKGRITDISYNLGKGSLAKFEGFKEGIVSGDYPRAAEELRYTDPKAKVKVDTPYFTKTGDRAKSNIDFFRQLTDATRPQATATRPSILQGLEKRLSRPRLATPSGGEELKTLETYRKERDLDPKAPVNIKDYALYLTSPAVPTFLQSKRRKVATEKILGKPSERWKKAGERFKRLMPDPRKKGESDEQYAQRITDSAIFWAIRTGTIGKPSIPRGPIVEGKVTPKPPTQITGPMKIPTDRALVPRPIPAGPKAGGMFRVFPKQLAQKGVAIVGRDNIIKITKPISVKDIQGNKVTLPKGEEYTPYQLSDNKVLLQDGEQIVISKNQMQNVRGQGTELKEFLEPEERAVEEVVKGGDVLKPGERTVLNSLQQSRDEGIPFNDEENNCYMELVGRKENQATKFSQYQSLGGENYREVLFKAPVEKLTKTTEDFDKLNVISEELHGLPYTALRGGTEQETAQLRVSVKREFNKRYPDKISAQQVEKESVFKSSHWDEPNVISHARISDLSIDSKGDTMAIEEIQSDWARAGREKGFIKTEDRPSYEEMETDANRRGFFIESVSKTEHYPINREGGRGSRTPYQSKEELLDKWYDNVLQGKPLGAPYHPLVEKGKWIEFTLKKLVARAVAEGKKFITWTTGQQQADRYDLSKHIDKVYYFPEGNNRYSLAIRDKNGKIVYNEPKITEDDLQQQIGKDVAARITQDKGSITKEGAFRNWKELGNLDLKIGGEWAKSLYDQQIPSILKKMGGKVTTIQTPSGPESRRIGKPILQSQPATEITPEMRTKVIGQPAAGGVQHRTYRALVKRMQAESPNIGLDDIAKTLQEEGILKVPNNRNADDYLKELVQSGAIIPRSITKTTLSELQAQEKRDARKLAKMEKGEGTDFDPEILEKTGKKIKPIDIDSVNGKQVLANYEKQKDLWFGKKDVRVFQAQLEKQKLQTELKTVLGQKQYTDIVKDHDKAMQVYIDTQRNPEHIAEYLNKLTPEQNKILELSQNLPPAVKAMADKIAESYKAIGLEAQDQDIIRNVLDNYAGRIWDLGEKKPTLTARKFGTTTRHAKARKFETILEGWANGFNLKVEGATNNLGILKEEIVKTIEDKKFIKSLQKIKTIDGEPLLTTQQLEGYKQIDHPNFKIWKHAGTAKADKVYGKNFFIDNKGNLLEKRALFAPEKVAKNMNNILGISKIKGIWEIGGVSIVDALTKFNAITKAWILQSSFFHHMAFMRSYWFGTNNKKWSELSPRQAYRQGLRAAEEENPIVMLGIKNGLTLGLKQDWNEELLREKGIIGKTLDKWKVSRVIKDKIMGLREAQADFLFGRFGAGLKAKSFMIEYRNLLKKHPNMPPDEIAKMSANLINDDFGGLHLGRLGRNPTVQHIFRLAALAPDWTESNIRTMVKAVGAGGKAEREFYRRFWAGILTKAMGFTVMANLLMAAADEDDKDAIGTWQRFIRNYHAAWKAGKFRWLGVDITPIYRALGGKTKRRKYFSILGHFQDPLKFLVHPIRSAHHKGSVLYKFFHEALTGVDWAGRRFTKADELTGHDYQKGLYKTNFDMNNITRYLGTKSSNWLVHILVYYNKALCPRLVLACPACNLAMKWHSL